MTGQWEDWDFSKPSRCLIACDGLGSGTTLYEVGGHLRMLIEEHGVSDLDEMGLGNAPAGISVWEGFHVFHGDDFKVEGTFRSPTEEEWVALKERRSPWDHRAWRLEWFVKYRVFGFGLREAGPYHDEDEAESQRADIAGYDGVCDVSIEARPMRVA